MVKEGAADETRLWAEDRPRSNAMGKAVDTLCPGLGNRKTTGQTVVIMAFLRRSKMGRVISAQKSPEVISVPNTIVPTICIFRRHGSNNEPLPAPGEVRA